jgi:GDSL-like Lipase/Acylhydrolase family
MADPSGISTDRRWQAAGIGALILAAVVVFGSLFVAHARHEPPMPTVSQAPLGNQKPKKVVAIGDSFTASTAFGDVGANSWNQMVFRQMRKRGVDINCESSGEPGSGYVARGIRRTNFGEEARRLLEPDDDLVIIFGGSSDAPEKPESVGAAVNDTFLLVRTVSPHAKVIAAGPASAVADPAPDVTRVRDIIRDDAAKIGATFVDPIADQWFVQNPTLIREDGSPTDAGHAYIAERLLPVIQGVLAPAAPWR